ncbi:MAG: hypothetical protein H6P99_1293 [Holophagaceae bacterium]|nr:hypothetical protein [Holophagaceae bacterium]
MGLLDMVGGLLGQGGQTQGNPLMSAVMGLIQNHPGGLQGLLGQFQEKGLGDQVASWIGTGENQPIGGDQVRAALGSDRLQQLAGQLGLSHGEAADGLAGLLPQVVDKLSPEGSLPEGADVTNLLKGLLG